MTVGDVIRKLKIICEDSQEIWDNFSHYFGKGFFNYPIEKEYGISPETHDKLIQRFDRKINQFKVLSD